MFFPVVSLLSLCYNHISGLCGLCPCAGGQRHKTPFAVGAAFTPGCHQQLAYRLRAAGDLQEGYDSRVTSYCYAAFASHLHVFSQVSCLNHLSHECTCALKRLNLKDTDGQTVTLNHRVSDSRKCRPNMTVTQDAKLANDCVRLITESQLGV